MKNLPKTHYFQAESVAYVYATEYFLICLSNDNEKDWDALTNRAVTFALNMSGTCFSVKVYNRYWDQLSRIIKLEAELIFRRHVETSKCARLFAKNNMGD